MEMVLLHSNVTGKMARRRGGRRWLERETHRQRGDGWEGSCATSAGMSVSVLACKDHRERISMLYWHPREDLSITWACWLIVSGGGVGDQSESRL